MGKIIKPDSMRDAMNSIKENVESYRSQYSEAKATLAGYSNDLTGIKGMTANAIFNQLSCYQSLMDMFILVADNMSDDCDAMIGRVGDEELIEDDINDTIEEQENIIKKCNERIKHYENLRRELAPYSVFADQCTRQINFNINCKGIAGRVIKWKNKQLKKIAEIDSSTKDLFVAEKATLDQISKCIEELKTSGQNGFTLQSLPPWATAMQNVLIKKYTDDMLNGDGRLNEAFVEKFADLTIAEMTPAELAAYREYVRFLTFDATPEDMNLVIECLHSPEHEISAYELALVIDAKTKEHCLKSSETVDSLLLEKTTIMVFALATRDTSEPGKISVEGGRYKYEYKQYVRSDYHTTSKESNKTIAVAPSCTVSSANLGESKIEYLKKQLRMDKTDYAEMLLKLGIDIGLLKAKPAVVLAYVAVSTTIEVESLPGEDEDFGVKSKDVDNVADYLKVRFSPAEPGTKRGSLFYSVYPTNETDDRLEYFNPVFEEYDIEPVTLEEIYNDPEAVNEKFGQLDEKLSTKPYIIKTPSGEDEKCEKLDTLEEVYYVQKWENGKS